VLAAYGPYALILPSVLTPVAMYWPQRSPILCVPCGVCPAVCPCGACPLRLVQLMALVALVGGVFAFLAFLCSSLAAFVALICVGELFLFAMQVTKPTLPLPHFTLPLGLLSFSPCLPCPPLLATPPFTGLHANANAVPLLALPLQWLACRGVLRGGGSCAWWWCAVHGGGSCAWWCCAVRGQSPANVVAMESVPPVLRPLAIAFSTIAVHVLGDVPSPPILGAIQVYVGTPTRDTCLSSRFFRLWLWALAPIYVQSYKLASLLLIARYGRISTRKGCAEGDCCLLLLGSVQDATQNFQITMPILPCGLLTSSCCLVLR